MTTTRYHNSQVLTLNLNLNYLAVGKWEGSKDGRVANKQQTVQQQPNSSLQS